MCNVLCIWQMAEVRSACCRQLVGSNRIDGQGDAAEAAADFDIRDPGAFPAAITSSATGVSGMWVAATMLAKVLDHARLLIWQVDFKEPTPAGEELIVRSQVVEVRDRQPRGAKSSVQVLSLCVPTSPR
jgi:acyl dehydratase